MQRGSRERAGATATRFGHWRLSAVLLLGVALGGCVGPGQIAQLTEDQRTTLAIESIDGPTPALSQKLWDSLTLEAGARQFGIVSSGPADYRLRVYFAARAPAHGTMNDATEDNGTIMGWVLDLYDSDDRRAVRLSGEEQTAGVSAADEDQVVTRIAAAGIAQLAGFAGKAAFAGRPASASSLVFGWPDDWTPEASGIFRILRRQPTTPETAAAAGAPLPGDEVPLPRGRPGRAAAPANATLALGPAPR
ncbi:MAG: hypothetical protein ACJ8F3_18540 [Xanthobacteraceae bacterium]